LTFAMQVNSPGTRRTGALPLVRRARGALTATCAVKAPWPDRGAGVPASITQPKFV
jgi:hypothetical protein